MKKRDVVLIRDELLTEKDVAKLTGISVYTLQRWRRKGEGPQWFRVGVRMVRYSRFNLDEWLRGLRNASQLNGKGACADSGGLRKGAKGLGDNDPIES